VNATEPNTSADRCQFVIIGYFWEGRGVGGVPKRVVNDSAASRNSDVDTALSFEASTGTSVKDFLSVSRKVPPGGYAFVAAMFSGG